jgi:hypothetical protein
MGAGFVMTLSRLLILARGLHRPLQVEHRALADAQPFLPAVEVGNQQQYDGECEH